MARIAASSIVSLPRRTTRSRGEVREEVHALTKEFPLYA